MNYQESLHIITDALKFGIDPSLEPIQRLCDAMGRPQDKYACIQIAGTNGKSSVSRMIAALLHAHGKHVGLYTSPHLVAYPERIEIDGAVISEQDFADAIEAAVNAGKAVGLKPTEFELLTAAALWLFARENVDVAVLECGLGGRWDATSVCCSQLAVITGIGLDHTQILGDTVEQIATEKAAIIKSDCTAVLASNLVAREVFVQQAHEQGAAFIDVEEQISAPFKDALEHMPSYQMHNAATALTATKMFLGQLGQTCDRSQTYDALKKLVIPGRFEMLRNDPLLIIDAAHNPQSARVLAQEITRRNLQGSTLVLGVLADKDAQGIVDVLVPIFKDVIVTQSSSPRALSSIELAKLVQKQGVQPVITTTVLEALQLVKNINAVVSGSITVAGEIKGLFSYHKQ